MSCKAHSRHKSPSGKAAQGERGTQAREEHWTRQPAFFSPGHSKGSVLAGKLCTVFRHLQAFPRGGPSWPGWFLREMVRSRAESPGPEPGRPASSPSAQLPRPGPTPGSAAAPRGAALGPVSAPQAGARGPPVPHAALMRTRAQVLGKKDWVRRHGSSLP